MIINLDSSHNLNTETKIIGVDDENYTERLEIHVENEDLWSFKPYIEFQTNYNQKYSTSELQIDNNGIIIYDIPNGVLKEGFIDVQIIFRKKVDDRDYVWKSFVKKFLVSRSVNADQEIEEEYPDFITELQELIDKIEHYSYEFEKLETIEEGAEVNTIETISKNGTQLPIDENRNVDIDMSEYALGSESGANFTATIDSSTYVMTFTLLDRDNNILKQESIDLPIESVIVNGRYDNTTKSIILTLQSGQTITIPVGDLISGLQSEITPNNMLGSDLVDDTNNVHKFVSQSQKDKLDNIESQAQVNILEGVKVNNVDLVIDANKKVNVDLTPYVLHENIQAVAIEDIRALFNNQENGGGE